MKILRRVIIVICMMFILSKSTILLPDSEGKYSDEAIIYDINKNMLIDNDKFVVDRFIIDDGKTYMEYKLIRIEQGWSFSETALQIKNDENEIFEYRGGGSSSKLWGEQGVLEFSKIEITDNIIIKYEQYDRIFEMTVDTSKEGDNS
ncbi:hypothetical protein [Vallitalea guaymasensis]|uniref:hypothetical protein n=1 Tax=Vallitalea guaymasensis TaxID=1185412 RepID=UPI002352C845|nr:hypothetical protein [Vallitalea guaymasensis]